MRIILSFAVLCILLNACNHKKSIEHPPFSAQQELDRGEVAVIYGKIINLHVYPHINEVTLKLADFSMKGELHVSPIDSFGEFKFEIYPIVHREFYLTPIEDRLMIAPGDTLYIEHDFSDFNNTHFSGTSAVLNREIAQFRNGYLGRYNFDYELSYISYKDKIDKQLQNNFEKLTALQKEHNTSELFNNWAEKQLRLDYYNALIEFPFQHFIRTKEEFSDNESYNILLTELENTIDDKMILFSYFRLMENYSMMKLIGYTPINLNNNMNLTESESIDLLSSVSHNDFFSQFAVASLLSVGLKADVTEVIDENEVQINKIMTNHFLRTVLQSEYNRVKGTISNSKIL